MAKSDLNDKLCHCGTLKEAIDIAVALTTKAHQGEDCMIWHTMVAMIMVQLHFNVMLMDMQHKGLPASKAHRLIDEMSEDCERFVKEQSGYIRAELLKVMDAKPEHHHTTVQ